MDIAWFCFGEFSDCFDSEKIDKLYWLFRKGIICKQLWDCFDREISPKCSWIVLKGKGVRAFEAILPPYEVKK